MEEVQKDKEYYLSLLLCRRSPSVGFGLGLSFGLVLGFSFQEGGVFSAGFVAVEPNVVVVSSLEKVSDFSVIINKKNLSVNKECLRLLLCTWPHPLPLRRPREGPHRQSRRP